MKDKKTVAIEFRNKILERLFEREANKAYWEMISDTNKKGSEEYLEAIQNIVVNEDLIEKDTQFLKIIEILIGEIK